MVLSVTFPGPQSRTILARELRRSQFRRTGRWLFVLLLALCGCARRQSTLAARSEMAERLSIEARQARERGDLKSAETLLKAAVERNPNDYETRLELSEMLLVHHNAPDAAAHLQMLLDQNPDDPRVYVGLAEARFQQRNLEAADQLVAKALDLDPRQARGLMLRAKIQHASGNTDGALEDLYQILDTDGEHVEARMLIARLHHQRGDARLAASELRSLIDDPNLEAEPRAKAQWLLGKCYAQDGRWSDAAEALTAGISSRRGSPRDWCLLADACRNAGDLGSAQRAVDNALQLSPRDSLAIALRGALMDEARSGLPPAVPVVARTSHLDDDDDRNR